MLFDCWCRAQLDGGGGGGVGVGGGVSGGSRGVNGFVSNAKLIVHEMARFTGQSFLMMTDMKLLWLSCLTVSCSSCSSQFFKIFIIEYSGPLWKCWWKWRAIIISLCGGGMLAVEVHK